MDSGGLSHNPQLFQEKGSKTAKGWFKEGLTAYYINRDLKKAEECYSKTISLNAAHYQAYIELVQIKSENFRQNADHETWVPMMMEKSLAIKRSFAGLYLWARYCLEFGKTKEGQQAREEADKQKPYEASEFFQKACFHKSHGNPKEAVFLFTRAIKEEPSYCLFYEEKAKVLSSMGNYPEVLKCYDSLIEKNPTFVPAYIGKGDALRYLKDQTCVDCYDKAISLDPLDVSSYKAKYLACFEFKLYQKGIDTIEQLMKIPTAASDPELKVDMGDFYSALEEYNKAILFYDGGINQLPLGSPNQSRVYNNKGLALIKLDRALEAIECFGKALQANNDDPLIYCNKGKAHAMLEQEDLALESFNKAHHFSQLNTSTNKVNKEFIDQTLNNDRKKLIENLNNLQQMTVKVEHIANKLNPKNELAVKFIKNWRQLKEEKAAIADQLMNKLHNRNGTQDSQASTVVDQKLAELQKKMEEMQAQISQVQSEQQNHNEILIKHEEALIAGGVYTKAEIRKAFEEFQNRDPQLYVYCKTFYWTSINMFGAYRSLSTGLMQGNVDSASTMKDDLILAGTKKLTGFGAEITKGIPFVQSIFNVFDSIVDSIYSAVKENRFQNRINTINLVIQSKFGQEEDISNGIAMVAIAMTRLREEAIFNPTAHNPNRFLKIAAWFKEKIEQIKGKVLTSINLHDEKNTAVSLALEDIALFISYLYENHESVCQSIAPLDKQCNAIVLKNDLDQMLVKGIALESIKVQSNEQEIVPKKSACCNCF